LKVIIAKEAMNLGATLLILKAIFKVIKNQVRQAEVHSKPAQKAKVF